MKTIKSIIWLGFMPFASDLPNNNFAAYEAEMVMWKCKWQNVTEKPITLIDTLKHAKPELYPNSPNNKRGISRPLHVNMCLVRKHQLDSPVSICCKSVHSLVKVQGRKRTSGFYAICKRPAQ
jgi:hypothetical protein